MTHRNTKKKSKQQDTRWTETHLHGRKHTSNMNLYVCRVCNLLPVSSCVSSLQTPRRCAREYRGLPCSVYRRVHLQDGSCQHIKLYKRIKNFALIFIYFQYYSGALLINIFFENMASIFVLTNQYTSHIWHI